MSDGWLWGLTITLFVMGMFYSGCETAFIASDRIRLRHWAGRGNRRAEHVLRFLGDPEYFLSAVLVGTNLGVIGTTTVFTAIATRRFGEHGETVATAVLVPTILIFSEILPKAIFLYYANRAAMLSVIPLRVLSAILFPIIRVFSFATQTMTRLLPARGHGDNLSVTMEELLFHLDDSHHAGLIPEQTTWLAGRALALRKLTARDVLVPLDDVVMVDVDMPLEGVHNEFLAHGFSRFPVYRGERKEIVGILSAHELLRAEAGSDARDHLVPPYSISLDTPIVEVLFEMKGRGRHMAVIRDGDGVILGITTLEDILERFVGGITDEFH